MVPKASGNQERFILFLILISLVLLLLVLNYRIPSQLVYSSLRPGLDVSRYSIPWNETIPQWFGLVQEEIRGYNKVKVGLVNLDNEPMTNHALKGGAEVEAVTVKFDRVSDDLTWDDFFSGWDSNKEKFSVPYCPEVLVRMFKDYSNLNIVVARIPCGHKTWRRQGIRDVFRLQINLVVANLVVAARDSDGPPYVIFVGSCEPMVEIFRCEDLIRKVGDYWVYKPDRRMLEQKIRVSIGSCQQSTPQAVTGEPSPHLLCCLHQKLNQNQ